MKTLFDAILAALEAKKGGLARWCVDEDDTHALGVTSVTLHFYFEPGSFAGAVVKALGGLLS